MAGSAGTVSKVDYMYAYGGMPAPGSRARTYTRDRSASAVACGALIGARWLSASST